MADKNMHEMWSVKDEVSMTGKVKVREFWIEQVRAGSKGYWGSVVSNNPNCITEESDFKDALHVIEKSAYERLERENQVLREAVEFYADKFNWRTNSGKVGITPLTDGTDSEIIDKQWTSGKTAREALAQADRIRKVEK